MKYFSLHAFFTLFSIFLFGCGSTLRIQHLGDNKYQPLAPNAEIIVINVGESAPLNATVVGEISIGDSGFTTDCSWYSVLNKAKNSCRKIGANVLQLTDIREPDFNSTCYRIKGYALRIENEYVDIKTGYTKTSLKQEWEWMGIDKIEGIYENVGNSRNGKYELAVKKINDDQYQVIYISGTHSHTQQWNEGDLKGIITKTASEYIYRTEWYMDDKSKNIDLYVSFTDKAFELIWMNKEQDDMYLKLYPTSNGVNPTPNIQSSGSGFALNDQGYIVTNFHVIDGYNDISIRGINSDFSFKHKARVVITDERNDLAILKIDLPDNIKMGYPPYVILEKPSEVGELVAALGYPLRSTMGDELKVTNGVISALSGFQGDVTCYQISTPIQPGNSGGPAIDSKGNIIGVVSSKHTYADNVGYAIKAEFILSLLDATKLDIKLNTNTTIKSTLLKEQIKDIRSFVYIIECQ